MRRRKRRRRRQSLLWWEGYLVLMDFLFYHAWSSSALNKWWVLFTQWKPVKGHLRRPHLFPLGLEATYPYATSKVLASAFRGCCDKPVTCFPTFLSCFIWDSCLQPVLQHAFIPFLLLNLPNCLFSQTLWPVFSWPENSHPLFSCLT